MCAIEIVANKKRKLNQQFLQEVFNLVGDEYEVLSEYRNNRTKIMMRHKTCGFEWNVNPKAFLSGSRCPKCAENYTVKKTNDEFITEVYNLVGNEYEFLEDYQNGRTKLLCHHIKCGHKWYVTPKGFLFNNNRCPYCSNRNVIKTNKQFAIEVFDLVGDAYEFLEEYKGSHVKIKCKHVKCGHTWSITPRSFLNGTRCPMCSCKKPMKTTEQFKKEVYDLVGDEYTVLEDYLGADTKIKMRHNSCGHIWNITPAHFLSNRRCPICTKSKGEQNIAKYLQTNNINYIQEYRLTDCKNKTGYILPFDFYLPDYNLLIEYDGEQHFEPVTFGGIPQEKALKNFKKQEIRDKIKNDYCILNNLPLLRIPYWEFNNIEEILNNKLNELEVKNVC
jgi:Zn ribbon nucleic-acid-binding protein